MLKDSCRLVVVGVEDDDAAASGRKFAVSSLLVSVSISFWIIMATTVSFRNGHNWNQCMRFENICCGFGGRWQWFDRYLVLVIFDQFLWKLILKGGGGGGDDGSFSGVVEVLWVVSLQFKFVSSLLLVLLSRRPLLLRSLCLFLSPAAVAVPASNLPCGINLRHLEIPPIAKFHRYCVTCYPNGKSA